MRAARLTALEALDDAGRAGLAPVDALVRVGPAFRRTLAALARVGLARWFPYGAGGAGAWKITERGRRALDEAETKG